MNFIKINKKKLGQFYTKNSKYITQGLIDFVDKNIDIIDPFCGEWDLLNLFNNNTYGYDIDPKNDKTIKRDTLLNPLNYENKAVVTNPPYLAKNKNKEKIIYEKYKTDDLYKAALLSIIGCKEGIIITPLNFFSSSDKKIRDKFLSKYKIKRVNVFEETVFDDTTYTVCSFYFYKEDNTKQDIDFIFFPDKKKIKITLNKEDGYSIGNEIYNLKKSDVKISRLLIGDKEPNSRLFLNAIDTGSKGGEIKLSIKEPYYGKKTDRAFATIVLDKDFSIEEQEKICHYFNKTLNYYREKYNSMFLSNYRNSTKTMARKRISFKLAYSIISYVIYKYIQ